MFDIGWGELLIIGIVALIAIGPKELPGALRALGQWMGKIRRMASEFQNQFQEAMREAELSDLKKEVDDMASQASKMAQFDPLDDVRKEIETAQRDIESSVTDVVRPLDGSSESATPLTLTSTSGGPDAASASVDSPPANDAAAPASAEPAPEPPPAPPVSASNTATAAPTAVASAEPTAVPSAAPDPAGTAKPDAGRAPA
jgi:sec-independent protein translocase protein TatB